MSKKLLECSSRGKRLKNNYSVLQYAPTHSYVKPYQCSECGKRFKQKGNLVFHVLIHSKEKHYQCSHCGKFFRQQSHVIQHERIHTKEKPYLCTKCGIRFRQKCHLIQHDLIHLQIKPYQCSNCNKLFRQKSSLNKHLLVHSNKKLCSYSKCDKQFKYIESLTKHVLIHSNEQQYMLNPSKQSYYSKSCNKRDINKSQLLQHSMNHLNSTKKDKHFYENVKSRCGKRSWNLKHCVVKLEKFNWDLYKKNKRNRVMYNRQFQQKSDFLCRTQIFQSGPPQDDRCEIKSTKCNIKESNELSVDFWSLNEQNTGDVSPVSDAQHFLVHFNEKSHQDSQCAKQFKLTDLNKHLLIHSSADESRYSKKSWNLKRCVVKLEKFDWGPYKKNKFNDNTKYKSTTNENLIKYPFNENKKPLCCSKYCNEVQNESDPKQYILIHSSNEKQCRCNGRFKTEKSLENNGFESMINNINEKTNELLIDPYVWNEPHVENVSLVNDKLYLLNDAMIDAILSNLTIADYELFIEQIWKLLKTEEENEHEIAFDERFINEYQSNDCIMITNPADIFPATNNTSAFNDIGIDITLFNTTIEEFEQILKSLTYIKGEIKTEVNNINLHC